MSDDPTVSPQELFGISESDRAIIEERYELERLGDAGNMGFVLRGRDKKLDRSVALKTCHVRSINFERQMTEARVLAKVESPNVIQVYDFIELDDDRIVIVMQWCDGETLSAKIKQNAGRDNVIAWMCDVCAGMLAAESVSVVHRDLKPANIMIDSNNRACVLDFGLSRLTDLSSLTGNMLMGTPLYMSPEQAEDSHRVDSKADIYSFGATFYHALTSQPPFTGNNVVELIIKHRVEPVVPPRIHQPKIPIFINDCIERCLAKNPGDRFQSFSEIADVLAQKQGKDPWAFEEDPALGAYETIYRLHRERLLENYGRIDKTDRDPVVFDFPGGRRLEIVFGRIEQLDVDAIVSSDDSELSMGGGMMGVSGAIARKAGSPIREAVSRYRPARAGRVVVTPGFELNSKFVFHGVTIDLHHDEDGNEISDFRLPTRDVIIEIIDACFYQAETFHVRSIAFPMLGTGVAQIPRDVCLDVLFRTIARRMLSKQVAVKCAKIVLFDGSGREEARRRGSGKLVNREY